MGKINILIFLAGALFYKTGSASLLNNSNLPLNFKTVNEMVIQTNCLSCHSNAGGNKGRVNLEGYQQVFKQKDIIRLSVGSLEMPPRRGSPLTQDQLNIILSWLDAGAQEF